MLVQAVAFTAIGVGLGALLGKTNSCVDGSCPLTANPKRGAIWGGLLGLMVALSMGASTQATGQADGTAEKPPQEAKSAESAEPAEPAKPYIEVGSAQAFKKEVTDRKEAAIVYFHAAWCGACKQYSPIFEKVAKTKPEGIRFVKVDVDKAGKVAQTYRIQYLPTTLLIQAGAEKGRLVGAVPEKDLLNLVKKGSPPPEEEESSPTEEASEEGQ